jgi:rhodanese-related sulfurtransferase
MGDQTTGLRIWRLATIVSVAVLAGLGWNAWSGRGMTLRANALIKPGEKLREIPAAEAREMQAKGALMLDARGLDFYKMGHIPGALSLPLEDFNTAFTRLEPTLRQRFDIIVYCAGYGCDASHEVVRMLRDRGVAAVILAEGWPAWTDAGYPTATGPNP